MSTYGIAKRFRMAEVPTRAAALAYHSLLGVVPAVGLILSYLELIGVTKQWRDLLKNFLVAHFNMSSSPEFLRAFETMTSAAQTRTSSVMGWLLLSYTSYALLTKLGNSLDVIFETSPETPRMERKFLKLLLRRGMVIAGLPIVLTVSAVMASWLQKDSLLRQFLGFQSVGSYLAFPIPIAVDIFALFTVYQFIPKKPGPWRSSLKAASIVGPIFWGVKIAVGVYNRHALASFKLYGALAALLLSAVWIHFAWMLVLAGALLIRDRNNLHEEPHRLG